MPRNPVPSLTPAYLRIEILTGESVIAADPNTLTVMAIDYRLDGLAPYKTYPAESILSGGPAVVYRTFDLTLLLTPAELSRLVRRALKPAEFLQLKEQYGDHFEWHDDFYDQVTGKSVQPKSRRKPKK